jgi:uncharacterized protein YdhG (YjbR/CyaY superfamily)
MHDPAHSDIAAHRHASTRMARLYCSTSRIGTAGIGPSSMKAGIVPLRLRLALGRLLGDMPTKHIPLTIDDYLKRVTGDRRMALDDLRRKIRSVIPDALECISYRIPAFRRNGVVVAGFCATAKGCSYFPFSGSTLKTLARELGAYSQTKSALHFSPEAPLPTTLVRKLIKTRIAETKE